MRTNLLKFLFILSVFTLVSCGEDTKKDQQENRHEKEKGGGCALCKPEE